MNSNLSKLLADSLFNKINSEYPYQKIINKESLQSILDKTDLNDKSKIKNIYSLLVTKIKEKKDNLIDENSDEKNLDKFNDTNYKTEILETLYKKDVDIKPKKKDNAITTKNIYLNINSNNRDKEEYPNCFDFSILFNQTESKEGCIKENLNNIKSIIINEIIIKDQDLDNIPYLLLEIDEIDGQYITNNKLLNNTYCILGKYSKINNYRFYTFDKKTVFDIPKTFNKLSFKLKDNQGNVLEITNNFFELSFVLEKININFFDNYSEYQIKDNHLS
jgi:hypothetical protein